MTRSKSTTRALLSLWERDLRRLAARRPLWRSFVVTVAAPLVLAALLATAFGALAKEVVDEAEVVTLDRELAQTLHELARSPLTEILLAVSDVVSVAVQGTLIPYVAQRLRVPMSRYADDG